MSTDFCFHIEVTFMFLWQLILYTGNIAMKVNEHEFIVFYSDEIEVQTHVTFYFRKVCLRLTSAFSKHQWHQWSNEDRAVCLYLSDVLNVWVSVLWSG